MSNQAVPIRPSQSNFSSTSASSDASSLPIWDRLSTWAAENKAVVYTIAGVAVVVSGAGVAYYLSDSRKGSKDAAADEKRKLSKKERRKAKQEKEREKTQLDIQTVPEQVKDQGEYKIGHPESHVA